ncbi:Methylamine utilisation protein MauE [Paenibacillus sp. RU4T]|jgi:hypothetical protein|uniref:MauE/DoxX family redox-associated membrane protein n=1 Tax=unclassified Paenibacillus TaxID=185978 RepID=UPI00095644DA|nr:MULTISPECIES: MauE/DoxX family redox-associated membrane protein [unclassified Paenibacillus]SIR50553.1 Methylamine utilisation protein MauE [Paenibacillus sp. RU4X]SIR59610.1 Methylamine utilisation protein MauE [Paenibacillus sp. RU4T]
MAIIERCLDIIIASIFFFSFYSKANQFNQFKVDIFSYKIMPVYFASFVSFVILLIEFTIFLAFSFSYPSKIKAIIVFILLVTFTILLWIKKKRVGSSSCGCFGQVETLNNHPFIRNILLMGLIVIEYFSPFYHVGLVQSLWISLGIAILVLLYDVSQLVGIKKGLIKWDQLKL